MALTELALGILGSGLLVYGVAGWSRPGACVVAGILLMAIAWWPAAKAEKVGR
jgi:hypothetical protein